jgi:hypothetical protein
MGIKSFGGSVNGAAEKSVPDESVKVKAEALQ